MTVFLLKRPTCCDWEEWFSLQTDRHWSPFVQKAWFDFGKSRPIFRKFPRLRTDSVPTICIFSSFFTFNGGWELNTAVIATLVGFSFLSRAVKGVVWQTCLQWFMFDLCEFWFILILFGLVYSGWSSDPRQVKKTFFKLTDYCCPHSVVSSQ